MNVEHIVPVPNPRAPSLPPRTQLFPDDPSLLPAGSVIDGRRTMSDVVDAADYVVIGTGAAGATAALVLAKAGYSVVVLEEGDWVRTKEFGPDVFPAMKQMYRDMGANVTLGRATYPVLQGKCVGGSTTINSAIALRAPAKVIENWRTAFGLGDAVTAAALDEHYEALERTLIVKAVPDPIAGNHNSLFGEATKALGIKAHKIQRYDGGCEASAGCITGCRHGKKLAMNITHVPQSLNHGARMYTSAKALRLMNEWGRATGVVARFQNASQSTLTVHARRGVIVCASAVQTPGILGRSGVKLHALGRHFQAQPGTSFAARFDRAISMDFGATQGFNSTHFVDSDRFKIESLSLPPELLSVNLPGIGPDLRHKLDDYRQLLNWALVIRAESEGRVFSAFGQDFVSFTPSPTDIARARRGLRVLSEMMFAAGAKEVWPSVRGMPTLKSADDLKLWDKASLDPRDYPLMMSHLFGSARMGPDTRDAVVGLDFQVHGLRGAYVLDSSIFPTNLGVNPQHTIMAMARLGATRIVEQPLPKI